MDKTLTIKQKILLFLENQGVKKEDFYKETGIAPSNFKGAGLNSALGGDKIIKILTIYPLLSADWLLRNEGEMTREILITTKENGQFFSDNANLSQIIAQFASIIEQKDSRIAALERENGVLSERIAHLTTKS